LTLARLDHVPGAKLGGFVQANDLFRAPSVPAQHFTLFSSGRQ